MRFSWIALVSVFFTIFSSSSVANIYVGASSSGNEMKFQRNYGDTLAPGGITMGNTVFAGTSLYSNLFGLEFGSSFIDSGSFKARMFDDRTEFGVPDYTGIGDDDFENRLKIKKLYIHVLKSFSVNEKVSLSPYIGFSYVKAKLNLRIIDNDGFGFVPAAIAAANDFMIKDSKFVPRMGVNLNLNISDDYGFRFGFSFENTNRLKLQTYETPARNRNGRDYYPEARPKNTTTVELGFFVNAF